MVKLRRSLSVAALLLVALPMVSGRHQVSAQAAGDAAFDRLAHDILADRYKRHPSEATDLGVHQYDDQIEDRSEAAIKAESAQLKAFRAQVAAIDPSTLSPANGLDHEQLLRGIDADLIDLDTTRMWAKDPDGYSGGITNAAYVIMKRNFAPAADRLKSLIAREEKMPAALQTAHANLQTPVAIYTQIAIEQIDGNISFFRNDVPAAFADVKDAALLATFKKTNEAVMAALGAYKEFLQREVLPKAKESFAFGADTYRRALAANEMIELPLDRLLQIAEADRQKNDAAFQATAKKIDPGQPAVKVLEALQVDHPPAENLLQTTQDTLNSIRQFIVDHHIVTIPTSEPARVKETPPFMRSTTSASMDTPGPFEKAQLPALYNMTLPDRREPRAAQNDFMRQWYYAAIANVSVHEVYPGHFIQFLYAKDFPSDVRKVFGAASNSEGWAHYCEQMMIDEGFHADDPKYRLAQLQDALLRDVRFIVGIKMHTQGMTVDDATKLFEVEGYQPHPVAVSEAKRGTADALYGYYTMGKLAILKLRDDYRAKVGPQYSLQGFHDALMKLGPLPLPLIRKALLGEPGTIF